MSLLLQPPPVLLPSALPAIFLPFWPTPTQHLLHRAPWEINAFLLYLLGSMFTLCTKACSVWAMFTIPIPVPWLQELRLTQPLARRLLTQLSALVSFFQMDKNRSRFGSWWIFVRHVAYFSLQDLAYWDAQCLSSPWPGYLHSSLFCNSHKRRGINTSPGAQAVSSI